MPGSHVRRGRRPSRSRSPAGAAAKAEPDAPWRAAARPQAKSSARGSVEPVVERVRVGTVVRHVAPSTPPPAARAADRDRLRLRLGSVGGLHACVRDEISEILRQHNQMAHGFGSEILTAVDGCFDDFSSAVQGIDIVRFELPTHSEESVGEDE